MIDLRAIRQRWEADGSKRHERGRRLFAASEARAAGWGGLASVASVTGLARSTIGRGQKNLDAAPLAPGRVRREGGGPRSLTITADYGGSNGSRVRLWKAELQKLADETGLTIKVRHYPPGTSKWNRIEHRLFCRITQNWRARPLTDPAAIIELIAATSTKTGLKGESALDTRVYEKGIKITNAEMKRLDIRGDASIPNGTTPWFPGSQNRSGYRCACPKLGLGGHIDERKTERVEIGVRRSGTTRI